MMTSIKSQYNAQVTDITALEYFEMAFADPTAYSKGQINRAGKAVRAGNPDNESLSIIDNWRASHAYILNTFQATLRNRTRRTDVAVAQRLKRMRTIVSKLHRQPKMELARMDDVAGCRLIFPDYDSLVSFRREFHRARFGHTLKNDISKYDYIEHPKSDGYRGVHDIYEYNVKSKHGTAYNGLLMELQYRTVYQHAWATSVEIIGMITENQPKFHAGDQRHIEFFRLASEIISRAFEKKKSCYPDLKDAELVRKFRRVDNDVHILRMLKGLNTSTKRMGPRKNVILSFSVEGKLDLFTYAKGSDALRKYFQLEKMHTGADVVLVKGDTGKDIRLAYKNYFSDPDDFVRYIDRGCRKLAPKIGKPIHKKKKRKK